MYHSCLDSLKQAKEALQNLENFIYWLEEDGVYVVDEEGDWILITFDRLSSRYFNRIDNVDIPELPDYFDFHVLARKNSEEGRSGMFHHTDQWRMRKIPPKEWPLFIDNASEQFEWMLRNGKHITPDEFRKIQAKRSSSEIS